MKIGYLSTIYHTSLTIKNTTKSINNEKLIWELYPTGPAMIKAFSAGEIDLGYIGLPPVMIGIDNGLKIKCIAGGHVEGTVLVAPSSYKCWDDLFNETPPQNKINNLEKLLAQFEGKTIGVPARGCIHDVIIREISSKISIEIKNYRWADLIPSALEEGEIDAGVGTPALAVAAQEIAHTHIITPPECLWPYNPSYGIVVREDIIEEKEEFLKEFLKIHENTCQLIKKNPFNASKIASKELGLENNNFALEIFNISPKYCASLSKEYMESTLRFIDPLKALGYLNSNLNEEDIFYTKLIKEVHPQNPHY